MQGNNQVNNNVGDNIEKGKLEAVEQALNKKDDHYYFRRRSNLHHGEEAAHDDWHDSLEPDENMKKKSTLASKVFIFSLIFFAGAVGFAFYQMGGGRNVVSDQNVELTITGPLGIKGGEEVQLQLQLVNNNEVPLEVTSLIIEYPAGTRLPDNPSKEVTRVTKDLGDIAPKQVVNETLRAIIFGEEKSDQQIRVEFEYHLPGSGAIYVKDAVYNLAIDTAPVSLKMTGPEAVTSGDEISLNVSVESNTGKLIPGLLLKVNYPPGFIYSRATPAPMTGTNNVWSLGDVSASSTRDVAISGTMTGQDNDTKAFQAIAGISTGGKAKDIGLIYNSLFQKIALKKPFLGLAVSVNESTDETVSAEGGTPVRASLSWANNTDFKLTDCSLLSQIGGSVDKRSVNIDTKGVYFSTNNTLVWNGNSMSEFRTVNPGDSGVQNLAFSSLPLVSGDTTIKNPTISLKTSLVCTKPGDDTNKPVQLITQADKTVKISTSAQFNASARYFTGPFLNTGPFPPKEETDTTYTIIWSLTNTSNNVQNSRVSAILPQYATWLNKSTGDGTVAYNVKTGEIVWTVGTLKAGVGYDSPVKQIAFQVNVRPQVTDNGSFINILGQSTFTGVDDFTKQERKSIKDALTTELTTDPGLPKDMIGKVE